MLTAYSQHRPKTTIQQFLAPSSSAETPEIAACLVGPKYLLQRYGRETPVETAFNAAGQTINFQHNVSGAATELDTDLYQVDESSVKLYAKQLEALLATFTAAGSPSFTVPVLSSPHIIKISTGHVKGSSLASAFRGRPVTVGDVVRVTGIDGGDSYRRTVIGLQGVVGAGTYGTEGTDGDAGNVTANPLDNADSGGASATQVSAPAGWTISCAAPEDFDGLAQGAKNVNVYGEEFIITVHTAGAPATGTVNISSVSGKFNATNVATVDASGDFSITDANAGGELGGLDLVLATPGAALSVGMSFRIRIVGTYERLDATQVVAAGTYTGSADTTYMVMVTGTNSGGTNFTGATVSITDTAGLFDPQTNVAVTENTAFSLGGGVTVKFVGTGNMPAQGGLRVGDIYFVKAVAGTVSTTNFDQVVLDGPAVNTLVFDDETDELHTLSFYLPVTEEIAADAHSTGTAWSIVDNTIEVEATLGKYISTRSSGYEWCAYANAVGTLVPSYRAIFKVAADAHSLQQITSDGDRETYAGDADLDNPLGYATQQALLGSEGKPVWILETGGTDVDSFEAALAAVEQTDLAYDYTILSSDSDVHAAAKAHVVSASSEDNVRFRRARIGLDSPGKYVVLEAKADTTNFTCTIAPHGGGNKLVTIISGADEANLQSLGLSVGDLLRLTTTGDEYAIASVPSDTELILSTGPDSAVDPAVACQIWKADTVANQKAWLLARANSMDSRRVTLCWSERPVGLISDVPTVIPVMHGAAYMSGMRSNIPPQVGLSEQPVSTFSAASATYRRYTQADLDEIASYGICIFSQDNASRPVRVRHQATTDTSDIFNFEESTTVRLDVVSRRLEAAFEAIRGSLNTTDRAVEVIRATALQVLNAAKQVDSVATTYGPLIDGFAGLRVVRSAQFADRIEVSVVVELGPPTNRIAVQLTAYAQIPASVLDS